MPKKYLCLANSLIEQITEGVYPKGCLLPSEREICEKYSEQMWLDLIDGRARDCFMDIIYIPKINERYQELQYTIVDCR